MCVGGGGRRFSNSPVSLSDRGACADATLSTWPRPVSHVQIRGSKNSGDVVETLVVLLLQITVRNTRGRKRLFKY